MEIIPIVSIVLEVVIALLALVASLRGRFYMIGFALTFGIYVYYDLARLYEWAVDESVLSAVFLVATLAALGAIIGVMREMKK